MIRQDPFDEDLEVGSAVRLRSQARGFIGLQALRFALYLATAGILPAILDPSAFSSLIQLGPIYMVVMVVADFGLGTHTTRTRGIDRRAASFSFWWSMAIATACSIALFLSIPALEAWFETSNLFPTAIAFTAFVLAKTTCDQHRALVQRQLRVTAVSLIESMGSVCSNGVAIWVALKYESAIGVPLGMAVSLSVSFLGLCLITGWIPGRPCGITKGLEAVRFGVKVLSSGLIAVLNNAGVSIFLGHLFSKVDLGSYERSSSLVGGVTGRLGDVFVKVVLPVFVRGNTSPESLRSAARSTLGVSSVVWVPAVIAMVPFFSPIVLRAYGDEWELGAVMLGWFAFGACTWLPYRVTQAALVTHGAVGLLVWGSAGAILLTVIAAVVGYFYGIMAFVAVRCVMGVVYDFVRMEINLRAIGCGPWQSTRLVFPSFVFGCLCCGLVFLLLSRDASSGGMILSSLVLLLIFSVAAYRAKMSRATLMEWYVASRG